MYKENEMFCRIFDIIVELRSTRRSERVILIFGKILNSGIVPSALSGG